MTTLVEVIARPRPAEGSRGAFRAVAALAGSLLIAGLAQIAIPLPFTPVPITGQTLGVLLVGASLGPGLGAVSVLLYLAWGAIGLPLYAGGEAGVERLGLASPTGGYLWGFLAAAALVGWLARRGWDRSFGRAALAMLGGEAVIYAIGVPWLAQAADLSLAEALRAGVYPFLIGDALKLVLAAGGLPLAWRLLREDGTRGRLR